MMPINLTRTNLLVYSCFWLFFFPSTNMLSFLCLVTKLMPANKDICASYFLWSLCLPAWFLRGGWASPACLAGALLENYPSASLEAACRGRNDPGSDPSVSTVLRPCSGCYVLDSLCVLGQAVKALATLLLEGLCEQSRLTPSCSPVRLDEFLGVSWGSFHGPDQSVKSLISISWVWPSACTHQGWVDNCTQRKMENRI